MKMQHDYNFSQTVLPEKQTQNGERTDVSSTAAHSCEDAANKTSDCEHDCLPHAKVGNRVVSSSFVLPMK
jgi:hypothetical protein